MKKLTLYSVPFLLAALVSCSSNILSDADSIKDSGANSARGAANTRTVTFNCQDDASGASNTIIVHTVSGDNTTVGSLPPDPVKTGFSFAGWWTAPDSGTAVFADTVVSADITVYAHWSTLPVYVVSFDTRGGSPISVRRVTAGGTLKSPGNPEKSGYLFGGWFREATCVTPWNFDTDKVGADTVLYAKWDSYTWVVTFIDSANPDHTEKRAVSSPAISAGDLPSPQNNGTQHFAGWWTGENGTGTQMTTSSVVTGDITVYAAWSSSQVYTVSFDSRLGAPVGSQSVAAGKTAARPDETTRPGYSFKGWYSTPDGKGVQFTTSAPVGSDKTWYAFWEAYRYRVRFECANSDIPAEPLTLYVETPATTIDSLPAVQPAKTGYLFAGWFTEEDGQGYEFTATTPVTSSMTVHAAWKSYNYEITFNTGSGLPATMTVNSPDTTLKSLPENPVRTGYIFDGWYTKPNGEGLRFNTTVNISESMTVYAKWLKACTVTFSANGGSGSMTPQTMAFGESEPFKANAFTRTGFTFAGWATSSYGTSAYPDKWHFTPDSASVTLYATWTINTYSISFNSNGGTGKMNDITMEYNKITTLNPNQFTHQGYEFAGWSTTPTGAVEYANLAVCTMGASNIAMYAVWSYSAAARESLFVTRIVRRQVTLVGFSDEWKADSTTVVLPNLIAGMPVTAVDPALFDKAPKLESIGIDPDNRYFVSKDGILFSKDMKTLYRYPSGRKESSYTVPRSVMTIADGAFREAWNLSTLRLETGTPPKLSSTSLTPTRAFFEIVVPDGSVADYRKADGWSTFADLIR